MIPTNAPRSISEPDLSMHPTPLQLECERLHQENRFLLDTIKAEALREVANKWKETHHTPYMLRRMADELERGEC